MEFLNFEEIHGSRCLLTEVIGLEVELPPIDKLRLDRASAIAPDVPRADLFIEELFRLSVNGRSWTAYCTAQLRDYSDERNRIIAALRKRNLIIGKIIEGKAFVGPTPELVRLMCAVP